MSSCDHPWLTLSPSSVVMLAAAFMLRGRGEAVSIK